MLLIEGHPEAFLVVQCFMNWTISLFTDLDKEIIHLLRILREEAFEVSDVIMHGKVCWVELTTQQTPPPPLCIFHNFLLNLIFLCSPLDTPIWACMSNQPALNQLMCGPAAPFMHLWNFQWIFLSNHIISCFSPDEVRDNSLYCYCGPF